MGRQQQRVEAHDKQLRALELRKAGASYETIAKQLGYRGRNGAFNAVNSALRHTLQEPADEIRILELARLDAMQIGLFSRAKRGDVDAINCILRIMDRRAKLLGLDAPMKTLAIVASQEDYRQRVLEFQKEIASEIAMLLSDGEIIEGEIVSVEDESTNASN